MTKKVLFVSVKNRCCCICTMAKARNLDPAPEHLCFKNWNSSSNSMESEAILEGFKMSVEMYGLRYNKLIADGDSSTYNKLLANRPYPHLTIDKVECTNHLLRNYCLKMKALAQNRLAGQNKFRDAVEANTLRMRTAANVASSYWRDKEGPIQERTRNLRSEILHSPFHIFGDHSSCQQHYCQGPKDNEVNLVPEMQRDGLWGKMMEIVHHLAGHSCSLIQKLTSNAVENVNSVIAKHVGGKRVNFTKSGSYQYRVMGAVLSHNTRALQSKLHRKMYQKSPGKFVKRLENRHQRKITRQAEWHVNNPRRRKILFNKQKDAGEYGLNANQPDMPEQEYRLRKAEYLEELTLDEDQRNALEQSTKDQSAVSLWKEERRMRITASNFGPVSRRKATTLCANLVRNLLYTKDFQNEGMKYGSLNESVAIKAFEESSGFSVVQSGLFVDPEKPFLGASPDGLVVGKDAIVEVKCPSSLKDNTPHEAIASKKFPFLNLVNGQITVNQHHKCYYQCPAPPVADVHETLHKIRAAANRVGFSLWDIFRTMEPPGKRVTAVHKFLSVLGGPLKDIIGLGEKELRNLAAYFKVNDGRIAFDQFCRMVHNEKPPGDEDEAVENPYTSNKLNVAEENRLLVLLTKIAVSCPKPLLLKPYFMDYELLKKNSGIVTRASFFRVLNFMGLRMSAFEHELIFDKYKCDNLSIKYAAFLNDLSYTRTLLRQQGYLDSAGRLYPRYDPTFPNAEASLLPRPERPQTLGQGVKKVFQPGWKGQTAPEEYLQILDKIKEHVTKERIRVDDIFRGYDARNLGRITQEAFKNGLEFMRLGRENFTDMYLSEKEMDRLCYLYGDPTDPERVVWQEFVSDVFEDVPSEWLARWPPLDTERPPRSPAARLPYVPPKVIPDLYKDDDGFFDVLGKKVVVRKVCLRKGFDKYDQERRGTVTEKLFEIAMNGMGFFFSQKEMAMIRDRYGDPKGLINFDKLVNDLEIHSDLSHMDELSKQEAGNRQAQEERYNKETLRRETNIVEVCAKIKKSLICSKRKLGDIIGRYDPQGTDIVPWETVKACCQEAGLDLTERELNTVHHVFQKLGRPDVIEYPLFTRVVDEHSVMACLVRLPLKDEMQQRRAPKAPLQHDFVNFEDRICISQAMKTLCKHITLGHIDEFKAMDPEMKGIVSRSQFMQLLHKMGVLHLISMRQIDSLMRGFGHEADHTVSLDYTAFLNAIDIVFCTEKAAMKL